jgi:hypothetical protein
MIAEDYLRDREQENKRFLGGEMLNIGEAYKAVDMARKEEREKALIAYQKMILRCQKCTKACSSQCGTDCLTNKFKELLNK